MNTIEGNGSNDNTPLGPIIHISRDGKLKTLDELLQGVEGNREVLASQLRAGDVLSAQSSDDHGNKHVLTMEIDKATWESLGMNDGFSPTKSLSGAVTVRAAGKVLFSRNARIDGSSFGGSMMSPGVFRAGEHLVFWDPERKRWQTPAIERIAIVRGKDSHSPRILDDDSLAVSNEEIREIHTQRLSQYKALMDRFGFSKQHDFTDSSKPSRSTEQRDFSDPSSALLTERDPQYVAGPIIATYSGEMALGNKLAIHNSETGEYILYKYYNFKGEDILQIAYANVKDTTYDPYEFNILSMAINRVHAARVAITTHNSGPNSNLLATNYKPSEGDGKKELGIPPYSEHDASAYVPDIQVDSGSAQIIERYPFSEVAAKNPGLLEMVKGRVSVRESTDHKITIALGNKQVSLLSPDEIYSRI